MAAPVSDGALLLALAALAAALAVVTALFVSYRRRLHELLGRGRGDPVPTVKLRDFDPVFATDGLGPTTDAEVLFIGRGDGVPGGTSDREAWILAVLARRAGVLFEFGTATGRTAYLWARNAPDDAEIATLTLGPGQRGDYAAEAGDDTRATRIALDESRFERRFRYSGTPVEAKVRQLFGDSKAFDEGPWAGRCDLIFVDGSHTRSYVRSDTEKALRMLAPGGVLLWHDYLRSRRNTRDVYRWLNELSRSLPLVRLAGTSLVAYRKPGDADGPTDPRAAERPKPT